MSPQPGHVIADKYRLIKALASGGMGSIWLAQHMDLDVEVAVKLMSTEVAESSLGRQRFRREARAAARLKSPHVTQIHDYGVFEDQPYIVMELLEGEDLCDYIDRRGHLSLRRCASIIRPVCIGLKLAHDAGIVHRDIKPSNIFLSRSGDEEVVKILDFGIAKQTIAESQIEGSTATGVVVGSPRYMSPEQAMGLSVDERSDIWSLGVVLYEMLSGNVPFDGDNLGQLITAICTREHAPITSLVDVPIAVDTFFDAVLRHDPLERLELAMVFARAVDALAAGEPLDLEAPLILNQPQSVPPPPRSAKARDQDDTVASGDDIATAPTESIETTPPNKRRADSTSPGVGLDTSRTKAPLRRAVGFVAVAVLVGLGALVMSQRTGDDTTTPAVATSAREQGQPHPSGAGSDTPTPEVPSPAVSTPSPVAVPSMATARASMTASASAAPTLLPLPPRPQPRVLTAPARPRYDAVFGVPETDDSQKIKTKP